MRSTVKNILWMISVLALSSCEEVYTSDDELFYQISKADSTRCMNEILEDIRETAKKNQDYEDSIKEIVFSCDVQRRDLMRILIHEDHSVTVKGILDSDQIVQKVVDNCMINRTIKPAEMPEAAANRGYKGFDFPFYNNYTLDEIEKQIERALMDYNALRKVSGDHPELINYYRSKVDEWEVRKGALRCIKSEFLPEMSLQAKVEVAYFHPSEKSETVLDEVAMAFYHLRNVECMRYFGETYLSLYERFQRKNRSIDKEKLQALEVVRSIVMFDKNLEISPLPTTPVLLSGPMTP